MTAPLLITNTDITGVLKNVYLKYRTQAFPVLTPLLANIKRLKPGMQNAKWGGAGVFFDVVVDRPTGMVNSDAGHLPNSAQARERQGTIGIRRSYVRRVIDNLAIQATQSGDAAYVPLAKKIMTEAMAAAKLGQQENLHGSGTGVKGIIGTVSSTTSIIVTSPYGVAGAGAGGLLLDVGMLIGVRDATGATFRGRATITAAANSGDNVTLTLSAAITGMLATDIVVTATAQDDGFGQGTNGLINLTNRGGSFNTLHGIDGAAFPRWQAIRMVAGTDTPDAAQPTELDIWQLCTLVASKSGKDPMSSPGEFLILTTPGVYRRLAESFLGQRRFDVGGSGLSEIKGGFKAVNVNGLALVQDFWCPAGTLYLIHLPSMVWVDLFDFQPISFEGQGPWRFVPERDAYEYNFGAFWNTGVIQRNSHGSITGYTDTVRYDFVQ